MPVTLASGFGRSLKQAHIQGELAISVFARTIYSPRIAHLHADPILFLTASNPPS
jgi:hypothetical protein